MNIEELQRRTDRLRLSYNRLDYEMKLLRALYEASQHLYSDEPYGARADALLVQVCREVVINAERIWELSGPDRLPGDESADTGPGGSGHGA